MEDTITLTQAELDAKVQEAVESATKDIVAKHNNDMAKLRKENTELKNASKTQEQLKEEQDEAITNELNELRSYKKGKVLEERLAKEGLPTFLKNDTRLLNATDETFDKVLKEVRKEYESVLPKGSQQSTVVQVSNGQQATMTEKDKANMEFGKALKSLIGK
jgi:predicted transcriptional regulator